MVTYSLYELLQRAIHDGRDSDVQELLQRSELDTIKTLGNNENSLLNDAASKLQLKIMSLLIENGVTRWNICGDCNRTLIRAIKYRYLWNSMGKSFQIAKSPIFNAELFSDLESCEEDKTYMWGLLDSSSEEDKNQTRAIKLILRYESTWLVSRLRDKEEVEMQTVNTNVIHVGGNIVSVVIAHARDLLWSRITCLHRRDPHFLSCGRRFRDRSLTATSDTSLPRVIAYLPSR
jgi:hypothetical protein